MSGVLSARTERLTRVYSDWHLKQTLTRSSCTCLGNSGSRHATLTSNRHLCLASFSKEKNFLTPPPPPLSRASRRHLRLCDSETQTRDFYGIEVDLAERRAEKEKWRRILAERAEQPALGTGNASCDPDLPVNIDNANLPSSKPTSLTMLVTPPPPPPAPAASMTLRDFNLEPRRARLMRKKAALGIPFDPDVTTLLKSGISVRFDANNGPMDAYPDEPLLRQNLRLDSLVGALAPLASVDKALKSVGELNAGTSGGHLNAGTSLGQVNAGEFTVAEDVERVGKRRRKRSNFEERGGAEQSLGSDVGNPSKLSTVPTPIQLGVDQSNLDLPPEGDTDMNLFDEQLMLAQFSIASPRHEIKTEDSTEDSLKNFHRDLERISLEKLALEQNRGIEDDVKATLIEDANFFDQLYLEHSDFRGMKLNDVTKVQTQDEKGVASAASSTKSDFFDDSSFDELNVFDQQMFRDESKLCDAASFVDMMEEVTSRSFDSRLPTESTESAPVLSYESATLPSSPEATSSSPSSRSINQSTSATCTMPRESSSMPISSSKESSPSPSLTDDLSRNLNLKPKFQYKPEEAPEPSRYVASLIRRRATWTFDTPVSGIGRKAETAKESPPLQTKTGSEGLIVEKKKRTLTKDELYMPPALRGEKRMDTKGFRLVVRRSY